MSMKMILCTKWRHACILLNLVGCISTKGIFSAKKKKNSAGQHNNHKLKQDHESHLSPMCGKQTQLRWSAANKRCNTGRPTFSNQSVFEPISWNSFFPFFAFFYQFFWSSWWFSFLLLIFPFFFLFLPFLLYTFYVSILRSFINSNSQKIFRNSKLV